VAARLRVQVRPGAIGRAEGQKLAFDRGKGNCLTCHMIKGGDLPGTIGPSSPASKPISNRDELVAIGIGRNQAQPANRDAPPFGRNRILTDKEISAW